MKYEACNVIKHSPNLAYLLFFRTKMTDDFHAITTFPGYQSLYENLKTAGVDLSFWTLENHNGEWKFDLEQLKSLIRNDTHLLVVNFPHNPSGYVPSEGMWLEIINLCKSRNIMLFSDEMYRLTNNDGTNALPSAVDCYDNAITLCGLSKAFSMPGTRIGWLACRNPQLMESFYKQRDYLTICSSATSEILGIIALRNSENLLSRTMDIIQSNLRLLEEFVQRHEDIIGWQRPPACTTCFMEIKGWLKELGTGGAEGFSNVLVKTAGVLLAPASNFDYHHDYVRLGFGRKSFPDALLAFEDFITKNKPK